MTQRRIFQEEYPYFVTWRTREGLRLFDDGKMAGLLSDIIFNAGRLNRYDILSYQIMPDHVHLLVNQILQAQASLPALHYIHGSAPTEGCARRDYHISQLIHTIKSFYCKAIRHAYGINYPIFQKRFYARIVNTDDYLRTAMRYIKHNPIKAELPPSYYHLPYQFFDEHKINALL